MWLHLQLCMESPKQHQSAPKTEKEEESQHHSLLSALSPALAHCCCRRGGYHRRCFMQLVHFEVSVQEQFLASVSLTMTNGSFVPLSTYSSLTKLLGLSYRKELSSIGTFSYNHMTPQSSKSNPFSSWNNLLKVPLRHTACLYSLPLMPWKKQKCAEYLLLLWLLSVSFMVLLRLPCTLLKRKVKWVQASKTPSFRITQNYS